MNVLGLTGGIGMGKSTVAKMFVENGFTHWDADNMVHQLYGWEPASSVSIAHRGISLRRMICNEFPHLIREEQNQNARLQMIVDRQAIRASTTPQMLIRLSQIVGPFLKELAYLFYEYPVIPNKPILYDVPLLFESEFNSFLRLMCKGNCGDGSGMSSRFRIASKVEPSVYSTVIVSCPPEVQRERVLARSGMTQERLDGILSRQMPDEEKRALADHVIDTSVSLEEVRKQVVSLCTLLKLSDS